MCQSYSKPKVGRFLRHGVYIHFWEFLSPDGILPDAKFTLCPSVAFSYIGSVTARRSSSGRDTNFAAWCKEWNYGTSLLVIFSRAPPIFGWAAIPLGAHILVLFDMLLLTYE